MRRSVHTAVVALAVTLGAAPAFAQELLVGGGVAYGSEIEMPGLQLSAYYAFGRKVPGLRIGGDVDGFLPNTEDSALGEAKLSWFDVNANAQYVFLSREDSPLAAYGLAGLNIAIVSNSFEYNDGVNQRDTDANETRVGVNLGAGAEYDLPFAAAFLEAKYVVSDADQLVAVLGLRFAIGAQ